jgi:ribonuclease G
MSRCVITSQPYQNRDYRFAALFDEDKNMVEVVSEEIGNTSLLDHIYIGRVEHVVTNLNAAFVRIADDVTCYLPFVECKNPIFTHRQSEKKPVVAGDELLVQVTREALKTKEPTVSTELNLAGQFVILSSASQTVHVSAKLSNRMRSRLKNAVETHRDDQTVPVSVGWIVRTNAATVAEEVVFAEMDRLLSLFLQMTQTASHKTCGSLLYRPKPFYLKYLDDCRIDELSSVVTDDEAIFTELCDYYQIPPEERCTKGSVSVPVESFVTAGGIRLTHHTDPQISLAALYSFTSKLDLALKKRVWLKSGANLLIEPTETMTVIDVNTAKNIAKKSAQENFLRINKEAAAEIARQLRLRNISGMILVDFINLDRKEDEEDLMDYFRTCLSADPLRPNLIDMTGLGLIELTRRKVRKTLAESLKNH